MSKNRIAVLYAGGTIGMQVKNNNLAPPKDANDFEEACKTVTNEFSDSNNVTVDFEYFDTKDSTERTTEDWMEIYKKITTLQSNCDAVVIAHGTDTLSNTAAAMSYAFGHPNHPQESSQNIPIVFTASQQPIYNAGGDGRFNLYHALEAALKMKEKNINRVALSLWDKVHLGVRAIKTHDSRYDAFDSPATSPIGRITSSGVTMSNIIEPVKFNDFLDAAPNFSTGITTLELSPSTPHGTISLLTDSKETKVLILKTLGEGNIPSRLIEEIKNASSKGNIVVITSPFAGGSVGRSVYELGAKAIEAGAIPAKDMVPPAVDAKCSWLVGNGVNDKTLFSKMLQTNHVGELS